MRRPAHSTSLALRRIAIGALPISALALAGAFAVTDAIGGSFLLGASLAALGGSLLMLSFSMHVRGLEPRMGVAPDGVTVAQRSFLARWLHWPILTVDVERHSEHRLDGGLTLRNGGRHETTIATLAITSPAGSKLAVGGNPHGAAPTTVRFLGESVDADATVPPHEKRSLRFHVLLGETGIDARRLRLRVVLAIADTGEHVRTVSTPIPG